MKVFSTNSWELLREIVVGQVFIENRDSWINKFIEVGSNYDRN